MRADDLRLTFAAFEVTYAPLPKFKGGTLADFFAGIHDRHPFEQFEQHGDEGAEMSSESDRLLVLSRSMAHYEEQVTTDFTIVRKTAVDLLGEIQAQLDVLVYRGREVRLRAQWESEDYARVPNFSDVIRDNVLTIKSEQYEVLGDGGDKDSLPGATIRFVGTAAEPHRHWDLSIEPYWRDEAQLVLSVNVEFFDRPATEPGVIGQHMTMAEEFLKKNVVDFIQSFMP